MRILTVENQGGAYGERSYDIYSLLLKERIIFLGTAIEFARMRSADCGRYGEKRLVGYALPIRGLL